MDNPVQVKTNSNSELVTSNHRRIIYDQEREILRFSEGADVSALNMQIQEGDAFITLYGDKYPISHDANGRLQILVKYKSGEHGYIGVYQEIFSRTWQLETKNSHPLYSRSQRALIQRLKLPLNKNYRYSIVSDRYPRAGPSKHIIEVRNLQDDVLTTAPLYMAIEMYGELVPLRVVMTGKHGLRYQIYDIHHPMSPSYLVIWDGRRWCFERWTSPHVSRKLSENISPVMFAKNVDESTLSAPDAQGIKWTIEGRGYIKVRRQLVEIHKDKLTYLIAPDGKKLPVEYRDHQFHPLPPEVLYEFLRNRELDLRMKDFYEMLKTATTEMVKDSYGFVKIEQIARVIFSPESVELEQIPAESLEQRRMILFVGKQKHILETTATGGDIQILQGNAAEKAIQKYSEGISGGAIHEIMSVRRADPVKQIQVSTRKEIDELATDHISHGAKLIREVLENIDRPASGAKSLLLAPADFLRTSIFENNVFASPEAVFQALIDYFIPLSQAHKGVIIVPGSIYVSKDVPDALRGKGLIYQGPGNRRRLDNLINFSTILAPVFYNGKLITIARKGEYLRYRPAAPDPAVSGVQNNGTVESSLLNMDQVFRPNSIMMQANERRSPDAESERISDDDSDDAMRTGTIFAGKTLMPGERESAIWYFTRSDQSNDDAAVMPLFGNEFMIDNEKFLLLVEDEFVQHGPDLPEVRRLALSAEGSAVDGNRYDWLLHSSAGARVDNVLISIADNYLHAAPNEASELVSAHLQHVQLQRYSVENQITLYDYCAD